MQVADIPKKFTKLHELRERHHRPMIQSHAALRSNRDALSQTQHELTTQIQTLRHAIKAGRPARSTFFKHLRSQEGTYYINNEEVNKVEFDTATITATRHYGEALRQFNEANNQLTAAERQAKVTAQQLSKSSQRYWALNKKLHSLYPEDRRFTPPRKKNR